MEQRSPDVDHPSIAHRKRSRDEEGGEKNIQKRANKKRKMPKMPAEFRRVRGKYGLLERLAKDVPLELMFEVFSYLDAGDLLNLARTNRDLRGFLTSKSSQFIWRRARANLENLPPIPKDLNELQYADLLFGVHCHICGRKGHCEPTFWSFRMRCCKVCALTFPHFYSLKRTQPEAYRNENVFPREFISGIRSGPACHIGHATMTERLREEFDALRSDKERRTWIQHKREEQEAIQEHAKLCKRWHDTMLIERNQQLRKERRAAILQKLEEAGWREEAEIIIKSQQSHLFLQHESVNQNKVLTDQAWRRIKPNLIRFLWEHRERRLTEEKERLIRMRYSRLRMVYSQNSFCIDAQEPLPALGDIMNLKFFEDLIWGIPPEDELTEDFFKLKLSEFLPRFLEQWRHSRIQEMVNVMQKVVPSATASDLHLATSTFVCTVCSRPGPLVFPEMFYHYCCRNGRHEDARMANFCGEGQDSPWRCCLEFSKEKSITVKKFVEACGLDPKTATTQDLYSSNPLVECLDCNVKGVQWNHGRLFMRWPEPLWHQARYPDHKLVANSFGEDTSAVLDAEPRDICRYVIRCARCPELFDSNRVAIIQSHLKQSHQIDLDRGTKHTLESLQEHWHWNYSMPEQLPDPNFTFRFRN
ncbi:hypothetical protein GYMLUDRAFT_41699 [Collybiopsis luxurians FD-317 M1]|uniref:F-box domain-containing protein n=1 Tax=Collybiopsis luxurians FD-317 M1 TaxID=944289 RepID=A0A0D0CTN3_9AGAR|nr:hypothetical protein GYMLUDRAFT_41699 [Collybiopsis luxurians FD-317 M1]